MALTKRKLQQLIESQSEQIREQNKENKRKQIIDSLHEEQVKSGKFNSGLTSNQASRMALAGAKRYDNTISDKAVENTTNKNVAYNGNTGINTGVTNNSVGTTQQNESTATNQAQNTSANANTFNIRVGGSPKLYNVQSEKTVQNSGNVIYPQLTKENLQNKVDYLTEKRNNISTSTLDGKNQVRAINEEINKTNDQLNAMNQKSGLSYIQKRGQESFANAMENINDTGVGAYAAIEALGEGLSDKNTSILGAFKSAVKAYNNAMEDVYKQKTNLQASLGKETDYADTDPAYKNARSKTLTKVAGDLNSSMANMLPSIMMSYSGSAVSPLVGNVLSAATTYANSSPEAYREARSEGATPKQASIYSVAEGASQAAGDALIGGVAGLGEGIVDKAVSKYAGDALNTFFRSRPMLKAVTDTAVKAAGEGAEEMIQSLITTGNKKLTYDPDAKIDVAGLAYEGALGALMGAAYGIPTIPGKYYVYKADYDTVNNFARAASQVKDFDSAQKLEVIMDNVVQNTEETIKNMETQKQTDEVKEDISRLKYIKDEVNKTKETFVDNMENIVNQNINQSDALEKVLDGKPDDIVENVANLVEVVAEGIEPDKNAINATIDYVQQEIQNKEAEYLASSSPDDKRNADIDLEALKKVDDTLRNGRKDLEDLINSYKEIRETEHAKAVERQGEIENIQQEVRNNIDKAYTDIDSRRKAETETNTVNTTSASATPNVVDSIENRTDTLQNESESGTIEPKQEETKAPKEFQLHHVVHKHTKTGEKMDVFKIEKSLSDKEYAHLKKLMKDIGGYYSSYAGGFIVKNPEAVSSFADTDYVKPTENVSEPKAVEKVETVSATDNTVSDSNNTSGATDNTISDTNNTANNTEVKKEVKKPETPKEITAKETKKQDEKKLQMPPRPVYHEGKSVEQYFLPGRKTPFAVSTQAAFDTIEVLSSESNTMQELYDNIKSDSSAKQVVGKYIENGYGSYSPNEVFGFKAETKSEKVGADYEEPSNAGYVEKFHKFSKDVLVFDNSDDYGDYLDYEERESMRFGDVEKVLVVKGPNVLNSELETECKTPQAAVNRFFRKVKNIPELMHFESEIRDYVSEGTLKSLTTMKEHGYVWGIEFPSDNETYMWLNVSNEYIRDSVDNPAIAYIGTDKSAAEVKEPSAQISDYVYDKLGSTKAITFNDLQEAANKAYGGTMAEGTYDVKAMTDAMELGVNRHIIDLVSQNQSDFNSSNPNDAADSIREINDDILALIPTQTKRSEEQISLQQFSTPPNIAYLASWVANINGTDVVLEPSAGIGGLASFAKADGATVCVNELSDSRLSMLKQLPFDGFYQENAEQIDNILPDEIKPSVVLMNPPFSSTGGRTKNSTKNAIPHIEQALARLEDGGRLVAIVGKGMANDTPTFKGWYDELRKSYDIRANVGINGENYRKYGTTFDVQMLVIDKTGAQKGETIVGNYDKLENIPGLLKGVRNDRSRTDKQLETRSTGERNNGVGLHDTQSKKDMVDTVSQRNGGNSQLESVGPKQQDVVDSNGRGDTGRSNVTGRERPQDIQEADRDGTGTERGRLDTGVRDSEGQLEAVHTEESRVQPDSESRPGLGQTELRERMGSGGRSVAADGGEHGSVSKQTVKKETTKKKEPKKKVAESDDGVYASYAPAKLTVTGAKKHPAKLVESAAMSAVSMPELHYTPHLDQSLIDSGALSDAQLENISYAGQAHEQVLPNGTRKGYFIGDGTGVGKGRQIAGIIMDNFNQGRKKAVWVSEKAGLFEDATRDWTDLGGNGGELLDFSKAKIKKNLQGYADGILFSTYDTLRSGGTKDDAGKKTGSNVDSIIEWLGKDFDGVIVFDEVQNLGNLSGKKTERGKTNGSMKAIAGNKLQESVPNARIVYVSATGATDITNLAYASRLGLWGEGTSFSNMEDFTAKIGRSGIAAMELVARDMKSMGVYLARSISYDGVKYDQIQHKLTKDQQYMYDTMSEGWQVVVQDVNKALQLTGGDKNSSARRSAGQVWSTMQNFYSQVLTSMSVPSVIKDIEKELAAGHSCVIQIVNTNEAAQDRAVSNAKENGDTSLDNLDITPRQMITQYVQNAFPVQQYEEYIDEQGNKVSKPVVDSKGNPVENKQAVRMREELLAKISEISIPEGPLDMIVSHFGADNVAEITGRNSRVVDRTDENGDVKKTLERRNSKSANIAEAKDFQDGKKRILVFSKAGGTGRSFHASNKAKNKEQRIHYVLQAGWKADDAVQGFGRTHRSDEANVPVYKLVTTDVMGQKRFVTSIARRLDQLGALTKGQRETGSGIFGEKDNLESPLSREALRTFYKKLGAGQLSDIDPQSTLQKMGLESKFYDEYGRFKLNKVEASDITHFLNRLLALPVEEQNRVFGAFEEIREQYYEAAIEAGTLDTGMENVKADKVTVEQDSVVRTDESTGAETKYVRATVFTKPTVIESVEDAKVFAKNFVGIRRMEDGSVRAVYRISDQTNAYGVVVKRYRLQSANTATSNTMSEKNMEAKTELVPESEWDSAWAEAVKEVPEYNERTVHMITGALLPIWNKLPGDGVVKAMRLTAEDGTQYLGRIIPPKQIDSVLRQLDVKGGDKKTYTGKEVYSAVMDKAQTVVFNGQYGGTMSVVRRRVSGENRMEILGGNLFSLKSKYPDIIQESIQFKTRYFIPTGAKGEAILSDMIETYKVRSIGESEDGDVYYKRKTAEETIRQSKEAVKDAPPSLDDLKQTAEKLFRLPINYGKTGGSAGIYKVKEDVVRIKQPGDFLTLAHEIGHKLDNRYNLHDLPEISELKSAFRESLIGEGYLDFQLPNEYVSEYVKSYMENADQTIADFPEFTKAFFSMLDDRDTDSVNRLASMSNQYYDSKTTERAQAAVHNRAEEAAPIRKIAATVNDAKHNPAQFMGNAVKEAWDGFMKYIFDDIHVIRGYGKTYDMAMRERQSGSVVRGWLEIYATSADGTILGDGLSGRLAESGITPNERHAFDSYLVDLAAYDHMEQEKKNPSGNPMGGRVYADPRVQASIEERIIETESKYPGFHDAANSLFEYDSMLLGRAVESGIISQSVVDTWSEMYPHYSPLYRVMDDKTKIGGKARSRYTDQNNVFKAFKGSGRDVYSPVENRMIQTEKVIKACMRNDVAVAFFNFIDQNDGMGAIAEKVPQSMYKDVIGLFPSYQKLKNFDFKSMNGMTEAERQNVLDEVQEAMGTVAESWKPVKYQNKNIVCVMRNGKPDFYEIHDTDVLKALTTLSPSEMNMVVTAFSKYSGIFKILNTGSNPFWALKNVISDTQTGYIFSKTTNNPVKYISDLVKATVEITKGSDGYLEYMSAGGGYQGSMTSKVDTLRQVEWNLIPHSTMENIMHIPAKMVEHFGNLVDVGESASRYAEYKRSRDAGFSVLDSMRNQQEITVNFSRHGKLGKNIDAFIPYTNSSLQAIYHDFNGLLGKADKKTKTAIWCKFLGSNVLSAVIQASLIAFLSSVRDEDYEKEYTNLSSYIKNSSWCIPTGDGKFIRVPKQKSTMALSSLIDRIVEYNMYENPRAFYDFGEYIMNSVVSIPGVDDTIGFGTLLSWARNETYTGSPIVPSAYQNLLPSEQYNENTSEFAKRIGSFLDISPMKVQFAIDDNLGFIGKFAEYVSDASDVAKEDGILAGIGEFASDSVSSFHTDNVYSTSEINYFYDTKEGYDTRSATYKVRGEGDTQTFYDTYGAYKYNKIADVYSKCNGLIKQEANEETQRDQRKLLNAFIKAVNDTEVSEMDEEVATLAQTTGTDISDIAPYLVTPETITKRVNKTSYYVTLTMEDMMEYYTETVLMFEENYVDILDSSDDAQNKVEALKSLHDEINTHMRKKWFDKIADRDGANKK